MHLCSAVLLAYNMVDGIRMTLPEGRDAEQSQTMALVARQAELAWRALDGQLRHPGWFAVKEDTAGEPPLDLDYFRRMVGLLCTPCHHSHHLPLPLAVPSNRAEGMCVFIAQ